MHIDIIACTHTLRAEAILRGELIDMAAVLGRAEPSDASPPANLVMTRAAFKEFFPDTCPPSPQVLRDIFDHLGRAVHVSAFGSASTTGWTLAGTDTVVLICTMFARDDQGAPVVVVMLAQEHYAAVEPASPGASSFAPYV